MVDTTADLESQLCICGRYAWRAHCPHCGSYHNYSYTRRDTVKRDDGSVTQLAVYRCRRCAAVFNDDEWKLHCAAPNVILTSRAGRKVAPEPVTKFDSLDEVPDVMLNALNEVKRKRGLE